MAVTHHPIVGAWTLQSFTERDIKSGALSHPMGQEPKATVIYTDSGHVATIFTATGRNAPDGPRPTDAEAVHLFRTMVAFSGRYEINGSELIYYPDVTWNEAWNGTRQVRYFEMADELLRIRSEPAGSALVNALTEMNMTWRRATQK